MEKFVKDGFQRMWKEAVMACFNVLLKRLPVMNE
jgi:hypothetical protein